MCCRGLLDRGIPTDAPRAQSALLIGAAQILWMDVPIMPRSICRCGWCSRTGAPRNMPAWSMPCCAAAPREGQPLIDEVKSQTLGLSAMAAGALDRALRRDHRTGDRGGARPRTRRSTSP
jgi:hypothetical protein